MQLKVDGTIPLWKDKLYAFTKKGKMAVWGSIYRLKENNILRELVFLGLFIVFSNSLLSLEDGA